MNPGTCSICGCSDFRPCVGGVIFPDKNVHRMVNDKELLGPGESCFWLDVDATICSAHTLEEFEAAGVDVPSQLGPLDHDDFEASA